MAKLKEDFDILKSKCGKIEAEKENAELLRNTATFKLQGYIDQAEEKDEIIKHLEIKIESKTKEIEDFKRANAKLLSQIKDSEEKEDTTATKITLAKGNLSLQQELAALKKKVRLQDYALKQLKTLGQLHESSKEEVKSSYEERVKRALTDIESFSDIEDSDDSLYLSETEVEQLVSSQKMIHERIEAELAQKRKMREEMEELRIKLSETLEQANPDIKKITTALVEEKVREMKESYDHERERLLLDLGNRVQKVCDLEMELDMMRDEYKRLERSLTREDMSFKNQITYYERQIEQMNLLYANALSDSQALKVDVQLYEKKLKTRESKISTLEKSYKTLAEQNNIMKTYLKGLQEKMIEINEHQLESHNLTGIASSGKIVKKIIPGAKSNIPQPGYRNKIIQKVIGDPFGDD